MLLQGISSCEPFPCLLPRLMTAILSCPALLMAHRPGLQCYQISQPLTASCWGICGTWSTGKITDKRRTLAANLGVCWLH